MRSEVVSGSRLDDSRVEYDVSAIHYLKVQWKKRKRGLKAVANLVW